MPSETTQDLFAKNHYEKLKNPIKLTEAKPPKSEEYLPESEDNKTPKGVSKYLTSGSLELGLLLQKNNIPYSFWIHQSEFTYRDAYILDLVSREDFISFDYNIHTQQRPSNTEVISNERGNLIYATKHVLHPVDISDKKEQPESPFGEKNQGAYILQEIIKYAKKHQQP